MKISWHASLPSSLKKNQNPAEHVPRCSVAVDLSFLPLFKCKDRLILIWFIPSLPDKAYGAVGIWATEEKKTPEYSSSSQVWQTDTRWSFHDSQDSKLGNVNCGTGVACNMLVHVLLLLLGENIKGWFFGLGFVAGFFFFPFTSLQEKNPDLNRANVTGHLGYYHAMC